jgi:RecG-like helicase
MKREWRGGGQFTSNLGPGRMRIAPRKEEGFQVSKRDLGERGISEGNQQGELARGINKGLRHNLILSICVYVP